MSEIGLGVPPDETEPPPLTPGGPVVHPQPKKLPTTAPLVTTPPEPEAPDTTAAPELGKLAILIIVLGLIAFAKAISDFLNWLFRTMLGPLWPRTGGKPLAPVKLTQGLSSALGTEFQKLDSELGMNFTRMGETVGLLGQVVLDGAAALVGVAETIARLEGNQAGAQRAASALRRSQQQTREQLAQAQQALAAQDAQHKAEIHALAHRVDQQQQHITHVLEPELDGLRHAIPELKKGATALWGEVETHSEMLGLAGATALTATALGRLGGGWIRCESNRLLGEANCGNNSDLIRKLLAGTIDVLALSDICDLSAAIVATGTVLRPGLEAFVSAENALIGCHGNTKPHAIPLKAVSATPVYATVSL